MHDAMPPPPSQLPATEIKMETDTSVPIPGSSSKLGTSFYESLPNIEMNLGMNSYLPGGVYQGRRPIIAALLSLDLHNFSSKVDYDVYWLGREEGVLLVGYGKAQGMKEEGEDSMALGVEQSWVLRRKDAEGDADDM
jgi:hypothetical protein